MSFTNLTWGLTGKSLLSSTNCFPFFSNKKEQLGECLQEKRECNALNHYYCAYLACITQADTFMFFHVKTPPAQ